MPREMETIMEPVPYKGYLIEPHTRQLRETREWTIDINIMRDAQGQLRVQKFIARNTFPTREEAERWCVGFGRDIIDRKVPGCTVDQL